ncbi:hypothetical protein NDU88_004719 [Pleurodeles waltl]|uniref:Uncharacterized protein n=1 Tax=Pleurodeles waltl TaxID=8319 RepID=A0AAV7UG57_PLEWA|nr:hypothetical protein NDU88_004719 [Pleurodeles waltl]
MTSGETLVSRGEKRKKERKEMGGRGRRRAEPKATTTGKEAGETPSPRRSIRRELKGIQGRKYRFPIAATRKTNPIERERRKRVETPAMLPEECGSRTYGIA